MAESLGITDIVRLQKIQVDFSPDCIKSTNEFEVTEILGQKRAAEVYSNVWILPNSGIPMLHRCVVFDIVGFYVDMVCSQQMLSPVLALAKNCLHLHHQIWILPVSPSVIYLFFTAFKMPLLYKSFPWYLHDEIPWGWLKPWILEEAPHPLKFREALLCSPRL